MFDFRALNLTMAPYIFAFVTMFITFYGFFSLELDRQTFFIF